MPNEPDIVTPILKEVGEERAFRTKIAEHLGELLKRPEIPFSLKGLIVIALFLLAVISVVLVFGMFDFLSCVYNETQFESFKYMVVLVGMSVVLVGLAVPVVLKAGNAEQAMRLNQSFDRIYQARASAA
jgi:asparagine N-glycosylation enzyme membrane subunit Stt3